MAFDMETPPSPEEMAFITRYLAAMHAVQAAIGWTMSNDPVPTEPKSLRVGIDSAHLSMDALIRLLVEKGVITRVEILRYVAEAAEREVVMREQQASEAYNTNIQFR